MHAVKLHVNSARKRITMHGHWRTRLLVLAMLATVLCSFVLNVVHSLQREDSTVHDQVVGDSGQERGRMTTEIFRTKQYRKMLQKLSYQECIASKQQSKTLGGYCLPEDLRSAKQKYYPFDTALAAHIYQYVLRAGDTVTDLGCGPGHYGEYWLGVAHKSQKLLYYRGFDGAANVDTITDGFVDYLDLTENVEDQYYLWDKNVSFWSSQGHDLHAYRNTISRSQVVMSLEVLEHVPKSEERKVLDNLIELVQRTLILSWAVPKQGGQHHVNERSNDYVLSLMQTRYGLKYCETVSLQLRLASTLPWFKNTIFVFAKVHGNETAC